MKLRLFRPAFALMALPAVVLSTMAEPAVAALPPASGASSNQATAQLLADAQKALKAGNLPLAVIHFKNASSADPRNGQVRAQLGIVLFQTGDFYAAER